MCTTGSLRVSCTNFMPTWEVEVQVESNQRLGRHRYVVERSLARLVGYRRLQVRYERRADILLGFLQLTYALICLNSLIQSQA
jgi:hypothetical protein